MTDHPLTFEVTVSGAGSVDPAPDAVERARAWFESRGASCHPVAAGLVCTMETARARVLFGAGVMPGGELTVPAELSEAVEAITVPPDPTPLRPPG